MWEGACGERERSRCGRGRSSREKRAAAVAHGDKTEPDFAIPRSRPSLIRLALRPSTLPLRLPRLGAGMRATRIAIVVDRKILQ